MTTIPPIVIPPDEAEREMLRQLIFEAEVAGKPERIYPQVRDALYDAWATIDDLREAQGTQGPKGAGEQ